MDRVCITERQAVQETGGLKVSDSQKLHRMKKEKKINFYDIPEY